jgi:phenylacetate-CoA ligase
VWNAGLNQLYMSSYHLSPATIPYYLDALLRHKIVYVLGYTSALYELACGALGTGRNDLTFRVVIANAEPVYPHQREAIEKAFHCPLRETYGMAEIVAAAGECEAGALHLWPEVGLVETLMDGTPVAAGTVGDLVATGLFNADMPLIRYRIGDRGVLNAEMNGCLCGRALPALAALEGRSDDVLYTRDGRRIGRLDPVFKAHLPIHEAQIIQETLDRVRVRYVPADGFGVADARSIVERLQQRLGDVEVILEATESIPRGPNGKFRAVVCQLPPEERERFARHE